MQEVHPAAWVHRVGRLLYFNAEGVGLLDVTTGAWQQLLKEPRVSEPALSPDGHLIAYRVNQGSAPGVYVRSLPGPSLATLVARDAKNPFWGDRPGALLLVSDSLDIREYQVAPNGSVAPTSRILVPRATAFATKPSAQSLDMYVTDDGRDIEVVLSSSRVPGLTVVQHFDALLKAAATAR
jgi:hypothetical protein